MQPHVLAVLALTQEASAKCGGERAVGSWVQGAATCVEIRDSEYIPTGLRIFLEPVAVAKGPLTDQEEGPDAPSLHL